MACLSEHPYCLTDVLGSRYLAAKHATSSSALQSGDYPTAIGHYTAAILADRADPTCPLNRAAAYLKLGKYVPIISPYNSSPLNVIIQIRRHCERLCNGINIGRYKCEGVFQTWTSDGWLKPIVRGAER